MYNALYSVWPGFAKAIGTADGLILTEKIIAMDAFFIVAFQVMVSYVVMKLKPLSSMTIGILINSLGLVLMVLTRNPFFVLTSIIIFSIGEMTFSPKILEYIGGIAPKDKAALYMGTQFLPIALGNFFGGFISGGVYLNLSDKFEMIKKMFPELSSLNLTNEQLTEKAILLLNTDSKGLNELLWNTYHPYMFGAVLLGLGIVTVILLFLYDRKYKKEVINI